KPGPLLGKHGAFSLVVTHLDDPIRGGTIAPPPPLPISGSLGTGRAGGRLDMYAAGRSPEGTPPARRRYRPPDRRDGGRAGARPPSEGATRTLSRLPARRPRCRRCAPGRTPSPEIRRRHRACRCRRRGRRLAPDTSPPARPSSP